VTRVVDLSVPLCDGQEGFRARRREGSPSYLGHECHAFDLEVPSHTGTYFETSAHVFRDGEDTESFPLGKLVADGVLLRVRGKERCITAAALDASVPAEARPRLAGCGLLVGAELRELGRHAYFSRDAAAWMRDAGVAFMGSDTPRYDSGFETPTGFFVELFRAGIPVVANLRNLELLPSYGFTLVALPLAVAGVCTVPCRVVAIIGPTAQAP
jgi:arylformamidase